MTFVVFSDVYSQSIVMTFVVFYDVSEPTIDFEVYSAICDDFCSLLWCFWANYW
jgi:hypothetical protein